jgi:riboflavin biosynthesis pyrimidine reductase
VWVEVLPVDEGGAFEPADVVARLASRGWRRLLIEGGGLTVSRFLEANALDRLHVSVAPLILGSGRPAFTLPEIETLDEARRPVARHFRLGTDLLFDLDLAD